MSEMRTGSNTQSADASADWMRQIRQQTRKCDEEKGVLRNLYKRAKSQGEDTEQMRNAIKATKLDHEEVTAGLRQQFRYMAILRIPISRESVFDWDAEVTEKTAELDDKWDASDKGYNAGRHGAVVEDAPYEPGTELHVHWMAAWKQGQAAIARELGPDVKLADSSKARPQREEPAAESPPAAVRRRRGPGRKRLNGNIEAVH